MTTLTTRQAYDIQLSAITDIDTGNIRTEFDDDSIKGLAASIKANGLLSPLVVRLHLDPENEANDIYMLVAGHRRYRALHQLVRSGDLTLESIVPCYVQDDASLDAATITMLVENLQREDISPIDEARGYLRLVSEFKYKTKDLAAAVGQSVAHINARLALVTLPVDLQACVGKTVSLETAAKIAKIEDEAARKKLAKQAVQGTLTSWAPDHALRDQDDAKAKAKLVAFAERNMLTIHPSRHESPAADTNLWGNDGTYDAAELAKLTLPKGAVLAFTYRGTEVAVYRKYTKAELAAREAARQERTVVEPADEGDNIVAAYWAREDAHFELVAAFNIERQDLLVELFNNMPSKQLGKIILEQQAYLVMNASSISFHHPLALCETLGIAREDVTPSDTLREYASTSVETALRINGLWTAIIRSESSPTFTQLLAAEMERVGLVDPGEFTEPEPWQDEQGNWHINEPEPEVEPDVEDAPVDEVPVEQEDEAA